MRRHWEKQAPHPGSRPAPQGMKIVQVVILSEAKDLVVEAVGYRGRDSSLRSE